MGSEPNQEHVTGPDKIQMEPNKQRNGHSLCLGKFGKVSPKSRVNLHIPDKRGDKALAWGESRMLIGQREFTSRSRRFLEGGIQGVEKKKIVSKRKKEMRGVAAKSR